MITIFLGGEAGNFFLGGGGRGSFYPSNTLKKFAYASWGHFNSKEKLKTMPMQNFGVTNKEHYGMLWYFWSGQLSTPLRAFQG